MVRLNCPAGGRRTAGATSTVSRMNVLSCTRLTKRFGSTVAVSELDLGVPAGQVYGFLGPNGAGKTTTIRMLLGLITPTAGHIELLGQAPARPAGRLPDWIHDRGAGFLPLADRPAEPPGDRLGRRRLSR